VDDLPKPLPPPGDWHGRGLCRWVRADFFPLVGQDAADARRICVCCAVREDCLEYAVRYRIRFGIWGGKTFDERRKLRRRTQEPRQKTPSRLVVPAEKCPCCGCKDGVVLYALRMWYCLDCRMKWPALEVSVG